MRPFLAPLSVVMVLAIVGLVAAIAYLLEHPPVAVEAAGAVRGAAAETATAEPVADAAALPKTTLPPLESYREIMERPLFSKTRRPPEAPVQAPSRGPAPPPSKATFVLTGVLVTPNKRVAILKPAKGGEARRVTQGGTIDGWKITSVKDRSVALKHGGQHQEVKLQAIGKVTKPAPGHAGRGRSGHPPGVPPARRTPPRRSDLSDARRRTNDKRSAQPPVPAANHNRGSK